MKSFKNIGKSLMEAGIDGATLYGAKKGFQIVSHFATKVIPATVDSNIQTLGVAVAVSLGADLLLPAKYARLAGAVAMAEAIDHLAGPSVDSALVKANLVSVMDLPVKTVSAPAGLPAGSTQGYNQMNGYASVRGMAGYNSMSGSFFPGVNAAGLPG